MGCSQHKEVERKVNMKKEKGKTWKNGEVVALMVKKSNSRHGWNQSKETCNYYTEQKQWARNCRKKKQDLRAKEEQKINVVVIKHLFKLCLLLLMIMHGMSILAHQCTFFIEGSDLGILKRFHLQKFI